MSNRISWKINQYCPKCNLNNGYIDLDYYHPQYFCITCKTYLKKPNILILTNEQMINKKRFDKLKDILE